MTEFMRTLSDTYDNHDPNKPSMCQYCACGDVSFPKCKYCVMTKEERTNLPIVEYLHYLNNHRMIPLGSELQKMVSFWDIAKGMEGLRYSN